MSAPRPAPIAVAGPAERLERERPGVGPRLLRRLLHASLVAAYRARNALAAVAAVGRESLPPAPDRPAALLIEPTNVCNANCTFCGYGMQTRPLQRISSETFRQAIDEYAAGGGGPLDLTPTVGDPLVDRGLAEKVAYARAKPEITTIQVTTNAILLSRTRFEELVDEGLTHLRVSVSGLDEAEYRRLFRSTRYHQVVANLEAIAESDRLPGCDVLLGLRTDSLLPWLRRDYRRLRRLGYRFERTAFIDSWAGRIRPESLAGTMFIRPNRRKRRPCSMLYFGPSVRVDGTITACGCRDLDGSSDLDLGRLGERALLEPWRDGTMEALRARFPGGDLPDICRDCRHYTPALGPRRPVGALVPSLLRRPGP